MKLKNKKTGEIATLEYFDFAKDLFGIRLDNGKIEHCASLTELNNRWVEKREPLIKNEKTREAIRAWAKVNGIDLLECGCFDGTYSEFMWLKQNCDERAIWFREKELVNLSPERLYTVEELCGEEEE